MNKSLLNSLIGNEKMTIVDAMERIDSNSKGVLFITDDDNLLLGCITDGDIRRWLIKTGDLTALVKNAMNKSPIVLFENETDNAQKIMQDRQITAIPIIDSKRCLKDVVLLETATACNIVNKGKGKSIINDVPVVIMAGGKGTRLYPYTKILPKPLIPIGDTPIVERIIDVFLEYGIQEFYLTVNYKKEMIKSYFSDDSFKFNIEYVEENMPLGTGGSLKLIKKTFDKPIIVANCDALILADYNKLYDYHLQAGNAITMVASLKNIVVPYGVLHTKENGELAEMQEKPKLSYLINTGMYVVNPEMINKIPDNKMFHMTHLIDVAVKEGLKVGVYPISEDSFLDMGEFDEMQRMEEKLQIKRG